MKAITDALSQYGKIVSELKIQKAIKSKLPPATQFNLRAAHNFLVFIEKQKRWTAPFTLQRICGKHGYVTDVSKTVKFNINQILCFIIRTFV